MCIRTVILNPILTSMVSRRQRLCTGALGLTSYEKQDLKGKTYAQLTAEINGLDANNLKEDIKAKYTIDENHAGLKAIEWLGVLDSKPIHLEKGSTFDLTSDLMIENMIIAIN